ISFRALSLALTNSGCRFYMRISPTLDCAVAQCSLGTFFIVLHPPNQIHCHPLTDKSTKKGSSRILPPSLDFQVTMARRLDKGNGLELEDEEKEQEEYGAMRRRTTMRTVVAEGSPERGPDDST
ncbi:hypothetical protein Ancab_036168, partial [Ancistrocladus abbreviatus]